MIKKRLISLMADSKKYIVHQVLWQWLGLLLSICIMFRIGQLLEAAVTGDLSAAVLREEALQLLLAALAKAFCSRNAGRASSRAGAEVKTRLRARLFEKLSSLGPSYHESVPTAEAVQVAVEGIEQLETYFARYLPQLFYSLLAPVTLFLALCRVSLRASLVLLVCVPLIPVTIVAVQKIAKRLLSKYWSAYTELGDSFLENLQGLTTLKIYRADAQKAVEMDAEAEHFRKITMKVLMMQLNSIVVMDLVAYGGAALGMVLAILEYRSGHLGIGHALTLLLLASEFFIPMRLLGSFFHIAMNGMAASDKLFRILDLPSPDTGREMLSGAPMAIEIRNVGFAYSGEGARQILKNIHIEIPKQGLISLAGVSGSGKSTIAALLTGRKKGYTGEILLTEENCTLLPIEEREIELSSVDAETLLRNITLLSHDSVLFRGTVRDNLLAAKPDATDEELVQALCEACLWDFLSGEDGLDTKLTENAGNLSGGQRQRLALARALLHDSPFYIFDEASSNIDAESEAEIMNVIRRLAKKHVVLQISHRLANTMDSDRIYVLENGEIIEEGSFESLIVQNGRFAAMYEQQKQLEMYTSMGRRQENAEIRH